jgi:hypothetical protein
MIISASRRTDIPAFFMEWFLKRIDEGFVFVRNPVNRGLISRIDLSPTVVDCIVFWSKNPAIMLNHLDRLKAYRYYLQFTITGYGQNLEPHVPPSQEAIATFIALSKLIGKERMIWRYDPIILTDECDIAFHASNVENIARQLQGKTSRCIISFVDMYKKTIRNMSAIPLSDITTDKMIALAIILGRIGSKYGLELTSCAEKTNLAACGIKHGKCIDDKLIEQITGFALHIGKDPTQRPECDCVTSVDIGAYNTCSHGCRYCYANDNQELVQRNYAKHDPESPLLFGEVDPNDRIHERKGFSCIEMQTPLLKGT